MKVVFRVDSSLEMGTGHVMRCLVLSQVLKENGANVEFICRKHKGNLIDKITSSGFNVHELEVVEEAKSDDKLAHSHWLKSTQRQDANDCIDILKSNNTDWLIVDHYALDEQWQKKLKPYYEKLMAIDDLADRRHQCDILLDQTFGRTREDYLKLVPKGCKLLLGSKYSLLRPEFVKWREYSLERRKKVEFKQLFVNMGGVDIDNFTGQILDRLRVCTLPSDISIIVVVGGSNPHLRDIRLGANALPYKTEVKVDVSNMAEIMANSDIAIGAAGSTTWERCCLGLPTIQMAIADNQSTIAKTLAKKNAIKIFQSIRDLPSMIYDPIVWMKYVSQISRKIVDGLGAKRVACVLVNEKI